MGIVLKEILKTYHGQPILDNLNLRVNEGEFHVLLGPSGSGKTTLLSIIAGLIRQDTGDILIGGRNIGRLPPEKRRVGFAFQDHALFPHLSVFENIAYGLRVKGMKEGRIHERVAYYLKKLNIENQTAKFPRQLSGGQRQRVALARTLATEPEILLMDEPMSSLDPLTKEKTGDELKRIQRESGMTTIYVTHNQEEAFLLGNRVSVLNRGKIEQVETPDKLFYHPKTKFVARFVGARNILNVSLAESGGRNVAAWICDEGLERPVCIRAKKYPVFEKKRTDINLCLHPEKITLKKESEVEKDKDNQDALRGKTAVNALDGAENCIKGKIVTIVRSSHVSRTTVDIGGKLLHAAVSNDRVDFQPGESVWLCFAADVLHPLCGRLCQAPESLRKCLNRKV